MAKYDIEVELLGQDGNAFAVMGRVTRELKRAGATPEKIAEYQESAMSGDYDNLLSVTADWVNIV